MKTIRRKGVAVSAIILVRYARDHVPYNGTPVTIWWDYRNMFLSYPKSPRKNGIIKRYKSRTEFDLNCASRFDCLEAIVLFLCLLSRSLTPSRSLYWENVIYHPIYEFGQKQLRCIKIALYVLFGLSAERLNESMCELLELGEALAKIFGREQYFYWALNESSIHFHQ